MKKSRHLAAIAVGTCVGLAGVGQVALASRGPDTEKSSSCSSTQSNSSNNSTGDVEQSGLINVGQVNLQGLNLSVLDNLLCHGNLLNGLTGGVLGGARNSGGHHKGDKGDGGEGCTSDQKNTSDNETGDLFQESLINAGGVAVQGSNVSALNNALCGGNVGNGLLLGVLGSAFGGHWSDKTADDSCSADQSNDSDNETGDIVGLAGLLNVQGVALQGDNIGALNNLLCGGDVLNNVAAAVLGIVGRL